MEELQIKISQEPAVIRCNFEDVKAQLSAKMAEYQGAVFTEESKSVAKAELASLRKTREEVEKRRKEVIATPEELEQVEMAFNSIGIHFERRQA